MSRNWEHVGSNEDVFSSFIPGPTEEIVRNTETGEERIVIVGADETVGEAIAEGRFKD